MIAQQGTSLEEHYRREFGHYSASTFLGDVYSGATVAMLLIPQALAYALLAGVPLTAGLLTAAFGTAIAALFGSSRHLMAGPTNATAIVIQPGLAEILAHYYRGLPQASQVAITMQLLLEVTLLVGVVQLIAGAIRLGRLAQMIKESVTKGFIFAAAIALTLNQLYVFLGVERPHGHHSLAFKALDLIQRYEFIHPLTATVGGLSALLYGLLIWRLPKLPNAVIMLVAAVGVGWLFDWQPGSGMMTAGAVVDRVQLVGDMGGVDQLFASSLLPLPPFHHLMELLPTILAIAALSCAEGISVSSAVASLSGQRPSLNRDICALGLANMCCSVMGGMPNSGSPSRSALNFALGAKTRLAAISTGIAVLLAVYLLSDFIQLIPLASLSALLLVTVLGRLLSWKQIKEAFSSPWEERAVLITMVALAFYCDLDSVFFAGLLVSFLPKLKRKLA